MAANKQKLTVTVDIQAQINNAQKAIESLGKSMNNAFNGNQNNNAFKSFNKIQEAIKNISAQTTVPMDLKDFENVSKQLKDVQLQIANIIQEKEKFFNASRDKQLSMLDKEDSAKLKEINNLAKKYLSIQEDITKKNSEQFKLETELVNKQKETKNSKSNLTKAYNKLTSSIQEAKIAQDALNKAREDGEDTTDLEQIYNTKRTQVQTNFSTYDKYANSRFSNIDNLISGQSDISGEYNKKTRDLDKDLQGIIDKSQEAKNALNEAIAAKNQFINSNEAGDFNQLKQAFASLNIEIKDFNDLVNLSENDWNKLTVASEDETIKTKAEHFHTMAQTIQSEFAPAMDQATEKLKNQNTELINSQTAADQAARGVENLKNKIGQLTGMAGSIYVLRKAFRDAWSTIKELDATMTETAVVTDFTISDMWGQLPEYTAKAKELGVAINDVYEASTLYYQQGLSTAEVNQVTTQTLKLARIAGLDAAEATDRMTAALRGFNMTINETNANNVADVYSKLAAITASDVDEISTAMTKVASLANSANMSFENTSAFLAQIIETTRESAETAGTALKTVIARFAEMKENPALTVDSEGAEISYNNIDKALQTVGISLEKFMAGQEGLDQVFMRLAEKWDKLDTKTQRYIATEAAGSRQQSRFIAMMSDYARTQELAAAAIDAAGASDKQYAKTLDSLKTKLQNLKNEWDKFTMNIMNSELLKGFIDFLQKILEKLNDITGNSGLARIGLIVTTLLAAKGILNGMLKPIIAITSALTSTQAITGVNSILTSLTSIHQILPNLTKRISDFAIGWGDAATSIGYLGTNGFNKLSLGLHQAMLEMNAGASSATIFGAALKGLVACLPTLLAIGAAITAIVIAYKKFSLKGMADEAKKANEALAEANSKLEETNAELQTLSDKIDELESKDSLTLIEQEELDKLRESYRLLKLQQTIEEKEAKTAQDKANKKNNRLINTALERARTNKEDIANLDETSESYAQDNYSYNKAYAKNIRAAYDAIIEVNTSGFNNTQLNDYNTKLNEIVKGLLEIGDITGSDYLNILLDENQINDYNNKFKELTQNVKNITENDIKSILGDDYDIYFNAAGNDINKLIEHVKAYAEEADKASKISIVDTSNTKDAITDIATIQKKLKSLSDAQESLNENGFIDSEILLTITDEFSNYFTNSNEFESILNNLISGNAEQIQTAFNDLTTAYLNSDTVLTDLNETTKEYYIQQLANYGITNSRAVIEEKLTRIEKNKTLIEQGLVGALEEVNTKTGQAQEQLAALYLTELDLATISLINWSEENITALEGVATACNYTGNALTKLKALIKILSSDTIDAGDMITAGLGTAGSLFKELETNGTEGVQSIWLDRATNAFNDAMDDIKTKFNSLFASPKITPTVTTNTSEWNNPLEKHYNLLQEIARIQNTINDLEEEYNTLLASGNESYKDRANLLKQKLNTQISELRKQERLLNAYTGDMTSLSTKYNQYKDYMQYNSSTQTINVNEELWEKASKGQQEKLQNILDQMKEDYEDLLSKIDDTEDTIRSIRTTLVQLQQQAEEYEVDLIKQTTELLAEKQQRQIDLQQEQLDAEREANTALLNSIQSNFSKLRQDRQNDETEQDIATLTRRLAYLKQDTSGANALEIKKLEKELKSKTQDYTDTLIDQSLEERQASDDAAYEQRQQQIDNQQSILDYMKENNQFEEAATKIVEDLKNDLAKGVSIEDTEWGKLAAELNTNLTSGELEQLFSETNTQIAQINTYLNQILEQVKSLAELKTGVSDAVKSGNYELAAQNFEELKTRAKEENITGDELRTLLGEALLIDGSNFQKAYNEKIAAGETDYAKLINDARDFWLQMNPNSQWAEKTGDQNVQTANNGVKRNSDGQEFPLPSMTLQRGSKGNDVTNVQKMLKAAGWNIEDDGSFGPATEAAIKSLQSALGKTSNGIWTNDLKTAWIEFMVGTGNWTAYKTGGLATTTGPAWLDGTPSQPELVLNAKDTQNFIQLKDILGRLLNGNTIGNNSSDTYDFNISINVDEISNDYDVDSLASRIKEDIVNAMQYRNNNFASIMR